MTPDEYLYKVLQRETVDTGPLSPVLVVQAVLTRPITEWANGRLLQMHPSGSFSKGTANKTGTDIDLFISLENDTIEPLAEIHGKLSRFMAAEGYQLKPQNVSQNLTILGYSVDLVPGKHQGGMDESHSLYRRKANTWTKTNVALHVRHVRNSGCLNEIRVLKLWRDQQGISFPSFYLELSVIRALSSGKSLSIANDVMTVFSYLSASFETARIIDPANTANCISDDLSKEEKKLVATAATTALYQPYWEDTIR